MMIKKSKFMMDAPAPQQSGYNKPQPNMAS